MSRMLTTLKDVASEAGVSYQTVWRAVHGKSGIADSTREHVLATAERLGYRRNALAGGLRTSRSSSIGLVVLDVSNPYTGDLTRAIQARAFERGHSLILMNSGDQMDREQVAVAELLERRVDGLILTTSSEGDHSYLAERLPPGLPVVAVNHQIPGFSCPTVASRSADVAAAARFLAGRGHRRMGALFGSLDNLTFLGRYRAFRRAVGDLRLPVVDSWHLIVDNTVGSARRAVRELLSQPSRPTAVVASASRLTEGALFGIRDLGLRRGVDVELVGFDVGYSELLDPPMPVLRQDSDRMGRRAVDILLDLMSPDVAPRERPAALPIEFVVPDGADKMRRSW